MKTRQLCLICNHDNVDHSTRATDVPRLDSICWACDEGCWDKYHTFKLDNLKLIEDIAKDKGLI